MLKQYEMTLRTGVVFLLLTLALSACVPAASSPSAGDTGAQSQAAESSATTGMKNVVYESLPDMDGAEIVAVTGNDYIPLNFIDPSSGEAVGWEYDAVNEICRRLTALSTGRSPRGRR